MAAYWIKLYTEMLDDPKVALLPGELYKRMIELFLLAGKMCDDKSGDLPDTRSIAWMLRMDTDQLQYELEQLAGTGIVKPINGGWNVVNFRKRQEPVPDDERKKQSRIKKSKELYSDEDVTNLSRNVTERRIERIEAEGNFAGGMSDDLSEDIQGILNDVAMITGLPVMFGGNEANVLAATEMAQAGVMTEDIQSGYDFMLDKGRRVVSARSLVNPSIIARSQRIKGVKPNKPKTKRQKNEDTGEWEDVAQ